MNTTNTFITVPEIQEVLSVSESKAYRIVRKLNEELKQKGYMVIPGRVSRHYFIERFYGMNVEELVLFIGLFYYNSNYDIEMYRR